MISVRDRLSSSTHLLIEGTSMYRLIASLALLFLVGTTYAQSPIKILSKDDSDFYISAPDEVARVGSAAMIRVYQILPRAGIHISFRVLISCDASWISTTFLDTLESGDEKTVTAKLDRLKQSEPAIYKFPIEFTSIGASTVPVASSLASRSKVLCASARREPRNFLIPVSSTSQVEQLSTTQSIVTGTASRNETEVDIWVRSTEYRRIEAKRSDGTPLLVEGETRYTLEPTGNYSMSRLAFDCRSRSLGTYEFLSYKAGKAEPDSESIDRKRLRLSSAVPGTVGEAQLDWVCQLY